MTGNQIIRKVRSIKGKLYGGVLAANAVFYIALEKKDLIDVLKPYGDNECGLELRETSGNWYLDNC